MKWPGLLLVIGLALGVLSAAWAYGDAGANAPPWQSAETVGRPVARVEHTPTGRPAPDERSTKWPATSAPDHGWATVPLERLPGEGPRIRWGPWESGYPLATSGLENREMVVVVLGFLVGFVLGMTIMAVLAAQART